MKLKYVSLVVLALVTVFVANTSFATSGYQVTPDEKRRLINKDVNGERWAITYDNDDGTVTGNVFPQDGGEPKFVACYPQSTSSSNWTFECYGSDSCSDSTACPGSYDWTYIADVTLPKSFFEPRGDQPSSDYPSYCSFSSYADAAACFGSKPSYCQYSSYADTGACFKAKPDFCEYSSYSNTLACIESRPDFCDYSSYSETLACIGSHPSYCEYSSYGDTAACWGTKPDYCQYSSYSEVGACWASNPSYCQYSSYSNAGACFGSFPSYCDYSSYADTLACSPKNRPNDTYLSKLCALTGNPAVCDIVGFASAAKSAALAPAPKAKIPSKK